MPSAISGKWAVRRILDREVLASLGDDRTFGRIAGCLDAIVNCRQFGAERLKRKIGTGAG